MNKEHTKELLKDFPSLYKQYKLPPRETCMCWGFDCKDGWFNIIHDLSQKIVLTDPECEATQVKQKGGGLRFYVTPTKKEVHDLIRKAEEKSFNICEVCGNKGKLRLDLGWIQTLCNKHYKQNNNKRADINE